MMVNQDKIKTIIVEDGLQAQENLRELVKQNFNRLTICAAASSIKDSVKAILKHEPELVFLDIELEDGLSFDIFRQLPSSNFEVIFVTAFDDYYKTALEHYALSYILKPIDEEKFIKAVEHYLRLKDRVFTEAKLKLLSSFLRAERSQLLINTGKEHIPVAISEIIKIEADGNYTQFCLANGSKHMASNTLKYYEGLLEGKSFFKAHRSVLVNTDHIRSIYKKESLVLKNNDKITVSVRNKPKLQALIELLS